MVAILTANIAQFEAAMGRAGAIMGSEGALAGAMRGMSVLGGAAVVGLGLVGEHSVKAAANFDAAMERISTQAHVPQSEIKGLSDGVLRLAGKIGTDPDSLAESLYHIESNFASLGIKGPDALKMVETAAKGAKIGGADVVDVTNALTAVMAAGIPGVKTYDQAMGALNATVGAGDMSMQDLARAMGTGVVAVAKGFGASIQDVGAALAVFGDNNIRGAVAGTQLRMVMTALGKPIKGSEEGLKKLGLQQDTLAKDMQKGGLKLAMQDLIDHMSKAGITADQSSAIITDVFGRKAGVGINILTGQFDRLKSKYPEINKGANDFDHAWGQTTQQFKVKMDQAKESIEAVGIKLGNFLIPYVEKAADAISKAIDWFSKHKEITELLATAIGGVLVVAIGSFIAEMLVAAAPVLAVVAAIAALAAGLKYAYDHFTPVRVIVDAVVAVFKKLWQALQDAWAAIMQKVQPALKDLQKAWQDNQTWIKPLIDFVTQLVKKYIELEGSALSAVIKALGWFIGTSAKGVINFFKDMINFVGQAIKVIKDIVTWSEKAAGAIGGLINKIGNIHMPSISIPGFEDGGWVPGSAGSPQLAIVHGGEFVVSRDMMKNGTTGAVGGGGGNLAVGQGGGAPVIEAHLYLDGEPIRARIQQQTLRYNQRNPGNGLALTAGR